MKTRIIKSTLIAILFSTLTGVFLSTIHVGAQSDNQTVVNQTTTGAQNVTTPAPTPTPTPGPDNCDPSYPDVCIATYPPDLNCEDIPARGFTVLPPDPHGLDGNDNDGIGCES